MPPALPRRLLPALATGLLLPRPGHAAGEATGTLGRVFRTGILRVGVWLEAPPWGTYDHDGTPDGAEVALARLLARDLGVRLRLQRLAVRDRIPALEEDRVDILAALVPVVPTTRRHVAFASPHGELSVTVATTRRSPVRSLAELAGLRVALPDNTFAAEEARTLLPPDTTQLLLPDLIGCIDAAAHGRADAAVSYGWLLRDLSLSRPDLDIEPRFTLTHAHHALAMRLGDGDLLRFVNTFLFLRGADGSLAEIHERYLRGTPEVGPVFR
ncbi:transporter substrate-binding domain-containing protein [Falsiroseomonas ponticola]|uniref:transporter substrate-binding domain-containing protein n=1 Tax=Falsiroseomonas ponticola TaxID=2786951 RepID=UPI0019346435|nr:transporter substrate-binding domain-containing protein [Roseomonas ponticola]